LSTVGTPPGTAVRYLIDARKSNFTVRGFATGMLSAFAHDPVIAIQDFEGEVQFAPAALESVYLRIVIPAASLTVTNDVSKKDREEMERKMQREVLETDAFPEIIYECNRASSVRKLGEGSYLVGLSGELALHGMKREQPVAARVTVNGESSRAAGEFSVRLSDYDIKPVTGAGGTIKLKDELKLSFDIAAHQKR
jgi:polyisoprenoid-binding protein YceI